MARLIVIVALVSAVVYGAHSAVKNCASSIEARQATINGI